MSNQNVVDSTVAYQLLSSFILLDLKSRGAQDNEILNFLETKHDACVKRLMLKIKQDLSVTLALGDISENSAEESWMADVANKAVRANLNSDGSDKHGSSQSWACAMEAVKQTVLEIDPTNLRDRSRKLNESDTFQKAIALFHASLALKDAGYAANETLWFIEDSDDKSLMELLNINSDDVTFVKCAKVYFAIEGKSI